MIKIWGKKTKSLAEVQQQKLKCLKLSCITIFTVQMSRKFIKEALQIPWLNTKVFIDK